MVRRKTHAVHEHLAAIQRAEVARRRIAETDHADQPVVDGIGHGHRVRELLSCIDAIAMAHGHIGIGERARRLAGPGELRCGHRGGRQHRGENGCGFHQGSSGVCMGMFIGMSPCILFML